ncbi:MULTISPECIES: energy transducer TonB [unclassified Pseudomonas]|uniref:energy transducer TonB n=1 Tax=unclassified Pseudomonas TaxID=196821 RepID=UPI0021C7D4FD|nr:MULTISPECIES: energy transducer TonB [unclassified Pseudomonas]MCU1731588.1 energy transducer TonB [Pseudomonas sp. 20P_3.2_Bac4]MCU1745791.1 energy transducer TonB [Pseudomonas sp. 20P_3.2_Bac5]
MLTESRRRAYLNAMQVVHWLPRTELPFAAPSRPELLLPLEPLVEELPPEVPARAAAAVAQSVVKPVVKPAERPKIEIPRPSVTAKPAPKPVEAAEEAPAPVKAVVQPPPRFALQLLRAGNCLLLVELATGEAFQSRDPSYLLLKDMLRAAGLPDSPQIVGEPVRWPLLVRGSLDQGPDAARDFVQGFIQARLEEVPCACLWLIGLPAIRFAGEGDETSYTREWAVQGLGTAWGLPSLELMMDEPPRKADVWKAMRRLMARWKPHNE